MSLIEILDLNACRILLPQIQLSGGFELIKLQHFTLAVLPFRQILIHFKKDTFNFEAAITKPALIVRIHWDFSVSAVYALLPKHTKKLYFDSMKRKTRIEGQIYDSWWQHQMSVRALRQPKPQYAGYLPIGWIVKWLVIWSVCYGTRCIRSWCTFFPQSHARRAKVNYCTEINGKKEEILGLSFYPVNRPSVLGWGEKIARRGKEKGESL